MEVNASTPAGCVDAADDFELPAFAATAGAVVTHSRIANMSE